MSTLCDDLGGLSIRGYLGTPYRNSLALVLQNSKTTADKPPLPDEEIEQLRQRSYDTLIGNHQRNALQELIRKGIVLLVACVLLLVHWRPFQNYDKQTA